MSFIRNQRDTYLRLVEAIRPHWRDDFRLPERIQKLLARDRRFGSRDRRLYRELLYTTLRFLPWVDALLKDSPHHGAARVAWLSAELPVTRNYREELTTNWPSLPASLNEMATHLETSTDELLPEWMREECPLIYEPAEFDQLHQRASLWLRFQTDIPDRITNEWDERGWSWRQSSILPDAYEIPSEVDVTKTKAYREGHLEIQDLGSQIILASSAIKRGQHWLDACAGAGGKTLQLARLLGPDGHVTAHDIRPRALDELVTRARRARLSNITTSTTPRNNEYDGILIDAPCSGTGTWRRAPHLKNITTRETVVKYGVLQAQLLADYATVLRSGGQLIYATCSLARTENEAIITQFLESHPDFSISAGHRNFGFTPSSCGLPILPARHNTDGFFVANLTRR